MVWIRVPLAQLAAWAGFAREFAAAVADSASAATAAITRARAGKRAIRMDRGGAVDAERLALSMGP